APQFIQSLKALAFLWLFLSKIKDKSLLMNILEGISSTRFHIEPWLFQYVMDSEKKNILK
ncbi:MAG: hypothetical protein QF682_08255, partial [Candidatus Thermoplasmatota archaeon]|nr:hypothetical protein [Candidatus Thermoplasmatota archaeon]